ncbi:hypothetical protein [Halorussus pelagicus]|uniref:hypothetical protein n=1 Tax=Halorussus pelagicus TaxID=2505977 RepID=UPI000FFC7AD1|nr:hypothetical protein [Halorussus pelagicus]
MSEEKNCSGKLNRRTTLKSIGGGLTLAAIGVPTVSARSERSYRETIEQSHQILKDTDSVEKQHKFLRNRGVGTAKSSALLEVEKVDSGASTQVVETEETSLWFSLYNDCTSTGYPDGTFTAELTWEYDPDFSETGYSPKDYAGIGWRSGSWDYETNNTDDLYSSDPDWIYYDQGSSSMGPAWVVEDWKTIYASQDNTRKFTAGVHLDWTGDSPSEKTISASYSHTWSNVTISGVGTGYPGGVTVQVADNSEEWTKDTNDSGDFLRLSKNDSIDNCR